MIIRKIKRAGPDAWKVKKSFRPCDKFLLLAPLCPTPPDVPEEGVREFEPLVFDQEVESSCAIEGETLTLQCHSFLTVYVQKASYGRNADNGGRSLCNGTKGEDTEEVTADQDCLDEAGITAEVRTACLGRTSCSSSVTEELASLGATCDGLKRELRTSHICGKLASLPFIQSRVDPN